MAPLINDDLLDARAGVEWANTQLKILEGRIEAWRQLPAHEIVEEIDLKAGKKFYKLANVRPLPAIVNAEAGLIVDSLRSSLDLLANSLAARAGHTDPKGMHFPICTSRDRFFHGKDAGRKEISLLFPADQKVIEDLEPWAGGHPDLFDIHTLDIMRKHRRLVRALVVGGAMTLGNINEISGFALVHPSKGFQNDSIVGWSDIDAPKPDINFSVDVVLFERGHFPPPSVLRLLDKFARSTAAIIELFD